MWASMNYCSLFGDVLVTRGNHAPSEKPIKSPETIQNIKGNQTTHLTLSKTHFDEERLRFVVFMKHFQ